MQKEEEEEEEEEETIHGVMLQQQPPPQAGRYGSVCPEGGSTSSQRGPEGSKKEQQEEAKASLEPQRAVMVQDEGRAGTTVLLLLPLLEAQWTSTMRGNSRLLSCVEDGKPLVPWEGNPWI
ncbi:hypothetical protein GBF38_000232 [Nibea albiflora]|nr:hypothetical protein GBF38_000232 [Nibea albiflora]